MNENEYFSSSDFALVATLNYLGFPIEALERHMHGRVYFLFRNTRELNEAEAAFWKKELRVEPSGFFAVQKEIKSRIYAE